MLYAIYSVYGDSVRFVWRHPYVLLLFYVESALSWFLGDYIPGGVISENFIRIFPPIFLLFLIFIFTSVIIYVKEISLGNHLIIWGLFKERFERALLLSSFALLFMLCPVVLFSLISSDEYEKIFKSLMILVYCNFVITCFFGILYQIFYRSNQVMESMKSGLVEFYKNFPFYVLVLLVSIVIIRVSLSNSFIAILTMPLILIFGEGDNINQFVSMIIYSTFSALQLVALNFAFIYKNKTKILQP